MKASNALTPKIFNLFINGKALQNGDNSTVTTDIRVTEEHEFTVPSFSFSPSAKLKEDLDYSCGKRTYNVSFAELKQIAGRSNKVQLIAAPNFGFVLKGSKGSIILNPYDGTSTFENLKKSK